MNMFQNAEQAWTYLLSGGRIQHKNWLSNEYLQLLDGNLVDQNNCQINIGHQDYTDFQPHAPHDKQVYVRRRWAIGRQGALYTNLPYYPNKDTADKIYFTWAVKLSDEWEELVI